MENQNLIKKLTDTLLDKMYKSVNIQSEYSVLLSYEYQKAWLKEIQLFSTSTESEYINPTNISKYNLMGNIVHLIYTPSKDIEDIKIFEIIN